MSLEYEAPDIYPAGVKLKRVLTLPGDQNIVIEDTVIPEATSQARHMSSRIRFHSRELISQITAAG